jgi:hypothetical protein
MFVQVNNPFESGWISCLYDLILDAFVFHQGRLGAKLKAASAASLATPTEAALLLGTRLSGVCRLIAGLTEEGLAKFHADDLEARWNGIHAKIIGALLRPRKKS